MDFGDVGLLLGTIACLALAIWMFDSAAGWMLDLIALGRGDGGFGKRVRNAGEAARKAVRRPRG